MLEKKEKKKINLQNSVENKRKSKSIIEKLSIVYFKKIQKIKIRDNIYKLW